jgi:Tol biopolymer transport system component
MAETGCLAFCRGPLHRLGTLVYLKWRQPKPVQPIAAVPLTAPSGWADYPAISPDGSRVVSEWTGEQHFTAFDLYVKTIGNENLLRLSNDPAVHRAPTWSPNGTQIAFQRVAKDGGGIYVVPAQGGATRKLRSTNASFDRSMRVSWSPDDRTIAFADSLFPVATSGFTFFPSRHCRALQSSTTTNASKKYCRRSRPTEGSWPMRVRFLHVKVSLVCLSLPRMAARRRSSRKYLEWLPDSKTLLFVEKHTSIEHAVLRELDLGNVRDRMVDAESHFSEAFSANGNLLAYVVNSGAKNNIWRGDLQHPDAPLVKLISTTRDQFCPRYSPDEKHIAFGSNRGGPNEIWMSDPDGQNVVQLTNLKDLTAGSPS